jgi:hypothetical protein
MDWYRLIAIYLVGTIGVVLSIAVGPNEGGFNRILGFGIMVHNVAEMLILGHIWFGNTNKNDKSNGFGSFYVIMYIWVILTLIAFLGEAPLFFLLMLQGGFCDWSLVATFFFMGHWMDRKNEHRSKMHGYGKFGTAAAVTHILSIQPLFLGIATSWTTLNAITVVLLVPTFILYIWFTAADADNRPIISQPAPSSNSSLNMKRNEYLSEMTKLLRIAPTTQDVELKQRRSGGTEEQQDDSKDAEVEMEDSVSKKDDEAVVFTIKTMDYVDIIREGLTYIEPANVKWMKVVALFGALMSVMDATLVFFMPCMVDFSDVVCN